MSNNFHEYVAYLDTHNAESKLNPNDNSTNDVIIPCRFPNRVNVAQISLGSLEIPLAQYNIENDWKTMQFDEGIDLYILTPNDESIVQLIINENGVDYVAQIPPRLNPIINISPTTATTGQVITFTTQYPHGLEFRGFFNWGEPMKVIGTPLTDPAIVQLTLENSNLTVISSTQFRLVYTGSTPITFNVSTIFGYVSTPSIPSPIYLAELVTLALNNVIPNHWKITYDECTGKFKLCWVGPGCDVRSSTPATLISSGNNSLSHVLGFGCANTPIPMPVFDLVKSTFEKPREVPSLSGNCVQSIQCSPCRSQIEIDVGNYNPDGLMGNIQRQLNRFYFDSGCYTVSGFSTNNTLFWYSTYCGICYSFPIPFGMYSPDSLASYIQSQMQSQIPSMAVTWDVNAGQFTFIASVDFGLEFDSPSAPNTIVPTSELAYRMGFYPISYRNNNIYKSVTPFYYPTKGCCGTSIPDRNLSYVYTPMPQMMLNNQKRFSIELSKTRSIQTWGPLSDNSDGTMTITTQVQIIVAGSPAYANVAHGFQVLDVVEITTPSGTTYELSVVRVDAYNRFTVDLGSIPVSVFTSIIGPTDPTSPPTADHYLCLRLSNAIVSNLYFSCQESTILPLTLGFNKCDYLWDPVHPTSWIAPAMYCLDYPNYVLVELTQPTGATHNMHAWNTDTEHTDTLTTILAKVILYPQFRMERSFPFHMIIPDMRVITRVQVRILNPDHTLYQFHNRQWSMTLVFAAVEKSINQLCY